MENEYGSELDLNGYAPSIIGKQDEQTCYLCKRSFLQCARHEIFHSHMGANRTKSKRLGLWVYLCPDCHMALHGKGEGDLKLKQKAQAACRNAYGWDIETFRSEFGKNYL